MPSPREHLPLRYHRHRLDKGRAISGAHLQTLCCVRIAVASDRANHAFYTSESQGFISSTPAAPRPKLLLDVRQAYSQYTAPSRRH